MKTLYCDYFVPKSKMTPEGEFWGAISITNHSHEKQICVLTILDYDTGNEIKSTVLTLEPKNSILLSNSVGPLAGIVQRTRLYLDCSKYVTATVGNSKGKISSVSWERMEELPFPKSITPSEKPICLGDDYLPFYRYRGNMYCCFLQANFIEVITETIKSIIIDRPSTKPFIVGDATPLKLRESCPGHPTHRDHKEIDFDYPLYSGKGTQFDKKNLERIWTTDGKWNLESELIDWWAIWQFVIRLNRNLGSNRRQFIIHEKIFDLIIEKSGIKQYSDDYRELYGSLSLDTDRNYNHHIHMHFNLRG
jgi:hypothetical protein